MKIEKKLGFLLLIVFSVVFFMDSFFIKPENTYTDWYSDVRLFSVLVVWLLISRLFRFGGNETLRISFLILVLLSLFFTYNLDTVIRERLASYLYVFLVTGVTQQLFEIKRK